MALDPTEVTLAQIVKRLLRIPFRGTARTVHRLQERPRDFHLRVFPCCTGSKILPYRAFLPWRRSSNRSCHYLISERPSRWARNLKGPVRFARSRPWNQMYTAKTYSLFKIRIPYRTRFDLDQVTKRFAPKRRVPACFVLFASRGQCGVLTQARCYSSHTSLRVKARVQTSPSSLCSAGRHTMEFALRPAAKAFLFSSAISHSAASLSPPTIMTRPKA